MEKTDNFIMNFNRIKNEKLDFRIISNNENNNYIDKYISEMYLILLY